MSADPPSPADRWYQRWPGSGHTPPLGATAYQRALEGDELKEAQKREQRRKREPFGFGRAVKGKR